MFDVFKKKELLSKEQIAELLNCKPELLDEFENAYNRVADIENKQSDNLFKLNAKDVIKEVKDEVQQHSIVDSLPLIDRIINELVEYSTNKNGLFNKDNVVTNEDLKEFPEYIRPQLTGTLYKKDTEGDSYQVLLFEYSEWLRTKDINWYHMFRQGLDILDLDPITYKIIGTNPASMGNWFPQLKEAVDKQDFFKVPKTKIVKVPLPILQLTRLDYFSLTATTVKIVDEWCKRVFELDENKTYFIKTGTYSSKFDFRNAKITTPKEVNEIGQYLLFIQFKANCRAHYDLSGRNQPITYGVSTTNEWVVREYIEDKENLPCIYHGMPLHTEYRVFVDCDKKEVLGTVLYWDSDTMKKRFSQGSDSETADMKHDYIIYCKEEKRLINTYNSNKDKVTKYMQSLLNDLDLKGQWSIDVMQNGDDFWIIDLAPAYNSALKDKINCNIDKPTENWLPKLDGDN